MAPGFRRFLFSSCVIVILLTGGGVTAGWLLSTKPKALQTDELRLPLLVKVHLVSLEDKQEFFTGYGTARAEVDASLASEVRGVVVEIAQGLDEGSHVEKGQLLVRIDDRQYQQRFSRAQALADNLLAQTHQLDVEKANIARLIAISDSEVEVNRNELRRLAGLFENGVASKKEYDFARLAHQRSRRQLVTYRNQSDLVDPRRASMEAQHAAGVADAELAKLDIERCQIRAPFTGEVVNVSVDVGDHVLLGGEVLQLISTKMIEVPIELPASVRSRVVVGAKCRLETDSQPGTYWDGRLARIAPVADPQSRTFSVYVEVDNDVQDTPLVPGSFLTARVEGPMLRQVMAIPRGALVGHLVYVVNDEQVHTRNVHVDRLVDEWAIVTGELNPGEWLVVTNLDALSEGLKVRLQKDDSEMVRSDESVPSVPRGTSAAQPSKVKSEGGGP